MPCQKFSKLGTLTSSSHFSSHLPLNNKRCLKPEAYFEHITSKQIRNALQDAILAIREDSLHIAAGQIGTHSIRSGAAMAMFLGGCPVFLIMMIGHWSSNSFLCYIQKQVKKLNHNVSWKMLTHIFHRHIPNYTSPTVSHLDPRQHNHPNNVEIQINVGGDMACQARMPASGQFHWALWLKVRKQFHLPHLSGLLLHTHWAPPSHTDPWEYKSGGSISFGANRVGQKGFLNHY